MTDPEQYIISGLVMLVLGLTVGFWSAVWLGRVDRPPQCRAGISTIHYPPQSKAHRKFYPKGCVIYP